MKQWGKLSSLRLAGMVFCLMAVSSATGADLEKPLLPAEASSPRDTLLGFLEDTTRVVEESQEGELSAEGYQAFGHAVDRMDFSSTPHANSWLVRTERALLLHEILNRLPLPPADEIPGDVDVADDPMDEWSVPDSPIRIVKIKSGSRAGQYLFSPETVERLDAYYRKIRTRPSRMEGDAYQKLIRSEASVSARERRIRARLQQIDAASPRSTLEGFLSNVNEAYRIVMAVETAAKGDAPDMSHEEIAAAAEHAASLMNRAVETFDLSEVPEAHRADVGWESALQLKEILDRVNLPPIDSIPDLQEVQALRAANRGTAIHWRFPNTEIVLGEVMEGERAGEFLFTAETVERLAADHALVQEFSYRRENYGPLSLDYRSPELSPGFYDYYISTPGSMVPHASVVGSLVEGLPGWFKTRRGDQMLWQWLALLLVSAAALVVAWSCFRLVGRLASRIGLPWGAWLKLLSPLFVALLLSWTFWFLDEEINLTGAALTTVSTISKALIALMAVIGVTLLCRAVAESILSSRQIGRRSVDASLVKMGLRTIAFFVGLCIVVYAARRLGADMVPLIAGLGVGGLAVALAAQRTCANLIGSLILYANRPVRVGDFCRFGDQIGTVEHIGLLTTRIRTLERSLLSVSNAEFSEMQLDNYAARDQRLFQVTLRLRLETTPGQVRFILAEIRKLLLRHPKVDPEPARARYVGCGEYAREIEIFAYFSCQEQGEFLAIGEDLWLRMEEVIARAGSGFALPAQTNYLARDQRPSEERKSAAETEVEAWREANSFPFPDFDEKMREDLIRSPVDYPPEGSPTKPRD